MNFPYTNLFETIEQYDTICIFRHEHPDCDALGSQNALALYLQTNYPDKKIYRLGYETSTQTTFPSSDTIDDATVKNSLAICLDTANGPRIDDQRFHQAKHIVKIDHHPDREPFGDDIYVFTKAAATCEILASFFYQHNKKMTKEIAAYLYMGLLTDTLCFKTNNTTSHTLQMASYLANFNIDLPALNRRLFDKSMADFRFASYVRENMTFEDGLAYILITSETQQKYSLTASKARNFIDEYGSVKEIEAWAIFTEREEEKGIYDGSLRAKKIVINDIATTYRGGGHPQAAGVKHLTKDDIQSLLSSIKNKLKNA